MSTNPSISVIMSVYNGLPYLKESVQSILNQTFEEFEFIIINDGSEDGTRKLLQQFADHDERILLVHQENNGLTKSLNRGLSLARGKYIARMDADDISHPQRLERQVQFLRSNPKIGIVFSWAMAINSKGEKVGYRSSPIHPKVVTWSLLFTNRFCHPSAMMRRSIVEALGGYAEWANTAQDYELWTRAAFKTKMATIPDALVKYRQTEHSVTSKKRKNQIRVCCKAARELHKKMFKKIYNNETVDFITWVGHEGVKNAKKETKYKKTICAKKYLEKVYKKYIKRVNNKKIKNKIKINMINRAKKIVKQSNDINKIRKKIEVTKLNIKLPKMYLLKKVSNKIVG